MTDISVLEVYSADDMMDAEFIRHVLAEQGIQARIIGESLQTIIGNLPAVWVTPRIWVCEEDFAQAEILVDEAKTEQRRRAALRKEWTCSHCGETNTADFEICWSCQEEDETQPSPHSKP